MLTVQPAMASSPLSRMHGVTGAMSREPDSGLDIPRIRVILWKMRLSGLSLVASVMAHRTVHQRGMMRIAAKAMLFSRRLRREHGLR